MATHRADGGRGCRGNHGNSEGRREGEGGVYYPLVSDSLSSDDLQNTNTHTHTPKHTLLKGNTHTVTHSLWSCVCVSEL